MRLSPNAPASSAHRQVHDSQAETFLSLRFCREHDVALTLHSARCAQARMPVLPKAAWAPHTPLLRVGILRSTCVIGPTRKSDVCGTRRRTRWHVNVAPGFSPAGCGRERSRYEKRKKQNERRRVSLLVAQALLPVRLSPNVPLAPRIARARFSGGDVLVSASTPQHDATRGLHAAKCAQARVPVPLKPPLRGCRAVHPALVAPGVNGAPGFSPAGLRLEPK